MSNQTAFAHPPKTKELIKACLKNKQQQHKKAAEKKKPYSVEEQAIYFC